MATASWLIILPLPSVFALEMYLLSMMGDCEVECLPHAVRPIVHHSV